MIYLSGGSIFGKGFDREMFINQSTANKLLSDILVKITPKTQTTFLEIFCEIIFEPLSYWLNYHRPCRHQVMKIITVIIWNNIKNLAWREHINLWHDFLKYHVKSHLKLEQLSFKHFVKQFFNPFNPSNAEASFAQSTCKDTTIFENHLNPVMLVFIG